MNSLSVRVILDCPLGLMPAGCLRSTGAVACLQLSAPICALHGELLTAMGHGAAYIRKKYMGALSLSSPFHTEMLPGIWSREHLLAADSASKVDFSEGSSTEIQWG